MTCAAVLVFAKAPVPGLAKTRLIPALGAEGAARLAERMLRQTTAEAVAADVGPVALFATPDVSHPVFAELARQHPIELRDQGDGDLGERMSRALANVLSLHPAALLIGTDAPALDAAVLRAAAGALARHDAVFVPAADGGYALIGLRRPAPELFIDMRWSQPDVMDRTRQRMVAAGLRHAELATLHDIDESADLHHLPLSWQRELGIAA